MRVTNTRCIVRNHAREKSILFTHTHTHTHTHTRTHTYTHTLHKHWRSRANMEGSADHSPGVLQGCDLLPGKGQLGQHKAGREYIRGKSISTSKLGSVMQTHFTSWADPHHIRMVWDNPGSLTNWDVAAFLLRESLLVTLIQDFHSETAPSPSSLNWANSPKASFSILGFQYHTL